jgi:hypothetical protein
MLSLALGLHIRAVNNKIMARLPSKSRLITLTHARMQSALYNGIQICEATLNGAGISQSV